MENQGAAMNMAMQIIIDHKNMVTDAAEAYNKIKEIFSHPISLEVTGDTNFSNALSAIKRFENAVASLDARMDGVGESAKEMADDVAKAVDEVADSTTKSTGIAKEELEEYRKQLEKVQRAAEKAKRAYEDTHKAGKPDEKLFQKAARLDEDVENLQKHIISLGTAGKKAANTAAAAGKQAASNFVSGFQSKFNVSTADLRVLIRAEDLIKDLEKAVGSKEFNLKINKKAVTAMLEDATDAVSFKAMEDKLKASLLRQAAAIRSLMDGTLTTGKGKNPLAFAPKIDTSSFKAGLVEMHHLWESVTKGASTGEPMRLRLEAHPTHLRESVNDAVRAANETKLTKLRLGVNQPHLLSEVEAAVAYANQHLKAGLTLGVNKESATAGAQAISQAFAQELAGIRSMLSDTLRHTAHAPVARVLAAAASEEKKVKEKKDRAGRMVVAGDKAPTLSQFLKEGEQLTTEQRVRHPAPRKVTDDEILSLAAHKEREWVDKSRAAQTAPKEFLDERIRDLREEFLRNLPVRAFEPKPGQKLPQRRAAEREFVRKEEERRRKMADDQHSVFRSQANWEFRNVREPLPAERPDFLAEAKRELERKAHASVRPVIDTVTKVAQTRDPKEHRSMVERALAKGILPPNVESVLKDYPDLFEKYRKPLETAMRDYTQAEAKRADAAKRAQDRRLSEEERDAARREVSKADRAAASARRKFEAQQERDLKRGGMVGRGGVRHFARTDPEGFLNKRFGSSDIVNDMRGSVRSIRSMYDEGLSNEERKRRTKEAIDASARFRETALAFEKNGAYSSGDKEDMKAFSEAFAARYITALDARVKKVRDAGPARDPKGALGGVDMIARDRLMADWQARAAQMRAEVSRLGGYIGGFGDKHVDPWKNAQRAFNDYAASIRKFEREVGGLDAAREVGEEAKAIARIRGAKDTVDRTEAQLRDYVLATRKGKVSIPEITAGVDDVTFGGMKEMDKAQAYTRMTEAARRLMGDSFEGVNNKRGEAGHVGMNFREFTSGVFSGDSKIAAEFLAVRGVAADILKDEVEMRKELEKQLGPLNHIREAWAKIDKEIEEGITHARLVTQMQDGGGAMGGYKSAIRNGFAMFGGIGLGMSAAWQLQAGMRQYMAFQQEIANIQGVVDGKNEGTASNIGDLVGQMSGKYGMNLLSTAEQARALEQAGLNVFKELENTLMGSKGLQITLEQMREMQIAVTEITEANDKYNQSIDWTRAVLEKISLVERNYATNAQDLSSAIQLLSPVMENFSNGMMGMTDTFDYTLGMVTTVVDRLRITGNQAARSIQMMLSRIAMPEILKKLQNDFGAKIGTPDGKDFLPIDQLLPVLATRYRELQAESPAKAKQFAVQLAGGRQVNVITTLLEEYTKVQEVASMSAYAWGDVNERAEISTNTLSSSVTMLNTNFQLWIRNLMEASFLGKGLIEIVGGLAGVMGGLGGTGAGGGTAMLGLLAGGAAFQGLKGAYSVLSESKKAKGQVFAGMADAEKGGRIVGWLSNLSSGSGRAAGAVQTLGKGLGGLANFFGPGTVLVAGVMAAVSAIGFLNDRFNKGAVAVERYGTRVKTLTELDVWSSPQLQNYKAVTEGSRAQGGLGYGNMASAYEDTRRILFNAPVGEMSGVLQGIEGDLRRFGVSSDAELNKFKEEHPEKLREFSREFTRIFVEQLPEHAKQGFNDIKDEGAKISKVMELVGGAAFAANVQIAAAIEEVRASTMRMVTDGIKGIQALDRARRLTLGARVGGFLRDEFMGGGMEEAEYIRPASDRTVFRKGQRESLAGVLSRLPGFDNAENDPAILAEIDRVLDNIFARENTLERPGNRAGVQVRTTRGAVINELLREARSPNSALNAVVQRNTSGVVTPQGQSALRAAVGSGPGLTNAEATQYNYEQLMNGVSNTVIQQITANLQGQVPQSAELDRIRKLLEAAVGTGFGANIEGVGEAANGAGRAVATFKDGLLDLVATFYESVRQFDFDSNFAKQFGTGFNRNDRMIDLGRNLLSTGDEYITRSNVDITRVHRELGTVASRMYDTRGDDDKKLPADARARNLLAVELGTYQGELRRYLDEDVATILGTDTAVYHELLDNLDEITGQKLEDRATSMQEFIESVGIALVQQGRTATDQDARRIQSLEMERELFQKRQDLLEAELPVTATMGQRLEARLRTQEGLYDRERAMLVLQLTREDSDKDAIQREIDKLDYMNQQTQVIERQTEAARARRALDEQIRTNLEGSVTGFRKLLTDTSIWEAIVAPEGDTSEQRARNKAEAIKNVIMGTLTPMFQTIQERIFDNTFDSLLDSLSKNSVLKDVMGMGEMKLKADLDSTMWQQAISQATQQGGVTLGQGIIQACAVGRQILAGAGVNGEVGTMLGGVNIMPDTMDQLAAADLSRMSVAPTGSLLQTGAAAGTLPLVVVRAEGPADPAAGTTPAPTAPAMDPNMSRKMQMQMMALSLGMMVGNTAGTMAGKGGKGAQLGAMAGSTIGGGIGLAVGGPVGGFIGSSIGGFAGGAFGGMFDKKEKDSPVVKGLEAIERAQRETIQTIEVGNNALLKPENRLLNLPSGFNIPAYMPSFGDGGSGGGGGSGAPVTNNNTVHLNVTVNGGDPVEVQRAVEDALANTLDKGRRNNSWSNPAF